MPKSHPPVRAGVPAADRRAGSEGAHARRAGPPVRPSAQAIRNEVLPNAQRVALQFEPQYPGMPAFRANHAGPDRRKPHGASALAGRISGVPFGQSHS